MQLSAKLNPITLETTTRSEYCFFFYIRLSDTYRDPPIDRQPEDNQGYAPVTCMIDLLFSGLDKRLVINGSASDDSGQSRHDELPQTDLVMHWKANAEVHGCPKGRRQPRILMAIRILGQ